MFAILAVGAVLIGAFYLNDSLRGETANRAALFLSMAIKILLALSFPLLLFVFRFFDKRELRRVVEFWEKLTLVLKRRRLTETG